jgi:hypothetical protein
MHFVQRMTLALIGHQSPMCEAIKGSSLKHENGVDFSAVNILLCHCSTFCAVSHFFSFFF